MSEEHKPRVKLCKMCKLPQYGFPPSEQQKPDPTCSTCLEAIKEGKIADVTQKMMRCRICHQQKRKERFSKRQWANFPPTCTDCVADQAHASLAEQNK